VHGRHTQLGARLFSSIPAYFLPCCGSINSAHVRAIGSLLPISAPPELNGDTLLDTGQGYVVSRRVGRDDVVADPDRQHVLAVVLLAADPHRGDDDPRLPPLQRPDDVHATEFL